MTYNLKRKNIQIYEDLHKLLVKYLVNKKNGKSIGEHTWELIRKDMFANGVKESEIKKAEKGTPWEIPS